VISLLLVACGGPAGVGALTPLETAGSADTAVSYVTTFPIVDLDPDGPYSVPDSSDYVQYGEAVAVGFDLDRDGRLEWAVSTPSHPNLGIESVPIAVYEGRELVHTLRPMIREGATVGYLARYLAGGGDTDGDGFGELLIPEEWAGFGTYVRVIRSLDSSEDILLFAADDIAWAPQDVLFQNVNGVDQPVLLSTTPGRWRLDRYDLTGVASGSSVLAGEDTQVFWEEPPDGMEAGQPVFADLDGDGVEELIIGRHRSLNETGTTWICPGVLGLEVPDDCETLTSGLSAGRFHEVGDLDGDGDLDIIAVASAVAGDDGEVWFLTAEGEVLAHLQGTRGNSLGSYPTYVVDDDGEAWVILAEFNSYASEPTHAYRFRVADLTGELTEADAETVWRTPGTSIGRQSAVYRETPDSPLQLILTEPYHDNGYVYLLPWP